MGRGGKVKDFLRTRLPKDRVKHMKGKETVVYQGDNGAFWESVSGSGQLVPPGGMITGHGAP